MKIINLGGATAIIEHHGKRMLFDPWLDDGIFHGAWYHYPPLKMKLEDIGRFDYVYISHIHEDHCSAGTIKHLNKDAEIIVMDKQPNYVTNFLKLHGFEFKKIHLIPGRTPTRIADDLVVDMLEADPANQINHLIDSALILQWGEHTIYNANDCPVYDAGLDYVNQHYAGLSLAMLPYAGGSGYPACYTNLTPEQLEQEKARISDSAISQFVRATAKLSPKRVMPFADQYVVAGSRAHLNDGMAHPACPGVVAPYMQAAGLSDRLLLLNAGQSFDLEEEVFHPNEAYQYFSDVDRRSYIANNLMTQQYDHEKITFSPTVPLDRLFQHARARLWAVQQRKQYFPDFRFYFSDEQNRNYALDLRSAEIKVLASGDEMQTPYLKVSTSATLFAMLLIGHVSWNIADAALFLDYERIPNVYDPELYVYLNLLRI